MERLVVDEQLVWTDNTGNRSWIGNAVTEWYKDKISDAVSTKWYAF